MKNTYCLIAFVLGLFALSASCTSQRDEVAGTKDSSRSAQAGAVQLMSSSHKPRGMSQLAEMAAGALLLRLEGASLSDEIMFEERAYHGALRVPARRLQFQSASEFVRGGSTPFSGELVIPDSSRQVYVRADGVTFETAPGAESALPDIVSLVASQSEVAVLARKDPNSPVYFVRNVFRMEGNQLTVDGEGVDISYLFDWVEEIRRKVAAARDTGMKPARPQPPVSPVGTSVPKGVDPVQ
jgi:hypothetical protein